MVRFEDIKVGNYYWYFDIFEGFVRGRVCEIRKPVNQYYKYWKVYVRNPVTDSLEAMQFDPKSGEITEEGFFDTFNEMLEYYKDLFYGTDQRAIDFRNRMNEWLIQHFDHEETNYKGRFKI